MRRQRPAAAAVFLLAMATVACSSRRHDDAAQIDALMRDYTGNVPGAAVLVIHEGLPVVRRSYGMADLEHQISAAPATNYRLASITKQFTAAAILLLMEEGKLKLDDSIRKWLPSLPEVADPITIRELLTHTSGLIDYEDVIPADTTAQVHDADVLHLLESQDHLYFPAGSAYRYSDTGYSLLSLIVGRVSGQDFATFLRERIFMPLKMQNMLSRRAFPPSGTALLATACNRGSGSAPTRVSPARCWAMAVSILPSTIWPSGMPRYTTAGC